MTILIILDPCDYITCEDPKICRLDYERNANCKCSEFCSDDFTPVCGSDGRTYTNECYLRRQACKTMPDLRIVFHGLCDEGRDINLYLLMHYYMFQLEIYNLIIFWILLDLYFIIKK